MVRVMVTAMPFTGHVTPMRAVAEALVARGHDVRFCTGRAFAGGVTATGARFIPWREAPDFDEQHLAAVFPRLKGKRGMAQVLVNMEDLFIGTAAAQVTDLEEEWAAQPWDVQVSEESSIAPRLFAERTGCPWATVTVLPLYLASREGPPVGAGLSRGRNPLTRARDAALRAVVPLLGRPLLAPMGRQRAALGLPPSRERYDEAIFSPRLVLASGVPSLDFDRDDRPPRLHWVGSLHGAPRDESELPPWWGELAGRRVVVVTQGTLNIDPEDLLRPALDALAGLDAVVVALTGIRGRDELPFPVPANVRVAGFVPFGALLPRADVLVTNGGWGGTLAALAQGVPLVLAGRDLDKPEVAARVAYSGAGVDLRRARPSSAALRDAVDRVSADPGYRTAATRVAAELAAAGGATRAAELVERLAG